MMTSVSPWDSALTLDTEYSLDVIGPGPHIRPNGRHGGASNSVNLVESSPLRSRFQFALAIVSACLSWSLLVLHSHLLYKSRSARSLLFPFLTTLLVGVNMFLWLVAALVRHFPPSSTTTINHHRQRTTKKPRVATTMNTKGTDMMTALLPTEPDTGRERQVRSASSCCGAKSLRSRLHLDALQSPGWQVVYQLLSLLSVSLLCVVLATQAIIESNSAKNETTWEHTLLLIGTCVLAGMQLLFVVVTVLQQWTPVYRFARSGLLCVSALQISTGLLLLLLNLRVSTETHFEIPCAPIYMLDLHGWLGLVAVVAASYSLNLVALFRGRQRIHLSSVLLFQTGLNVIGIIAAVIVCIDYQVRFAGCDVGRYIDEEVARMQKYGESDASIARLEEFGRNLVQVQGMNLGLIISAVILYLFSTWLAGLLPAPTPSRLVTEELHLATMHPTDRQRLCASLEAGNRILGARGNLLTAEASLELMQAYQAKTIPGVRGVVLRIGRFKAAPTTQATTLSGIGHTVRSFQSGHGSVQSVGAGAHTGVRPGGPENAQLADDTLAPPLTGDSPLLDEFGQPLSKNAIAKLQRKQKAKAARAAAALKRGTTASNSSTLPATSSPTSFDADVASSSTAPMPATPSAAILDGGQRSLENLSGTGPSGSSNSVGSSEPRPRVFNTTPVAAPGRPPLPVNSAQSVPNTLVSGDMFLAFVTIIDEHDTSSEVSGLSGRILSHIVGSKSPLPWRWARPAVMRMGLIGFQFPFKSGIWPLANSTGTEAGPSTADSSSNSIMRSRAATVTGVGAGVGRSASATGHVLRASTWQLALKAILEWNESQPASLRCDILLLPSQANELVGSSSVVSGSGFFPIDMPPTHILDLRRFAGQTFDPQFLATGPKKGSRVNLITAFQQKGGEFHYHHPLEWDQAEAIVRNSQATAAIRMARSEHATLLKPTVSFVHALTETVSSHHVNALLLYYSPTARTPTEEESKESDDHPPAAYGDHVVHMPPTSSESGSAMQVASSVAGCPSPSVSIASCMVFEFPGSLMTSDIHGQIHSVSRPLKAYFTMMQLVVARALARGIPFIDFGPTTSGPKQDIGCDVVRLSGSAYCRNLILGVIMRWAARAVVETQAKTPSPTRQPVIQ